MNLPSSGVKVGSKLGHAFSLHIHAHRTPNAGVKATVDAIPPCSKGGGASASLTCCPSSQSYQSHGQFDPQAISSACLCLLGDYVRNYAPVVRSDPTGPSNIWSNPPAPTLPSELDEVNHFTGAHETDVINICSSQSTPLGGFDCSIQIVNLELFGDRTATIYNHKAIVMRFTEFKKRVRRKVYPCRAASNLATSYGL
eukprot:89884-Pyramimonas_sp.AAC.1